MQAIHSISPHKIAKKLRYLVLRCLLNSPLRKLAFASYWHNLLHLGQNSGDIGSLYLGARPNPAAGIGHQLANWNAGYWWAGQFGLKFAHSRFSSASWEEFLGFGIHEASIEDLIKRGYKVVKIPTFNETLPHERRLVEDIITSYHGRKVVLLWNQDQSYAEQIGTMEALQQKFHNAPSRANDNLLLSPDHFNIAIHVRRGDIVAGKQTGVANHLLRWQDNDYFRNVLGHVLKALQTDKPVAIYLFSQGSREEFKDFETFGNLHFCLDMGAKDSFLHMVFADLLITSKSSFSYKPALLSRGIRVCPRNFWHAYPDNPKWILAEEDGTIPVEKIAGNG